jgi:oxygen-dependent protoporphyrinogen oxidase
VLYEKRSEVGGQLRTDDLSGVRVDPAVQLLSSRYEMLLRLASETGARELLVASPGRDALWRRGEAHTIAYGSVRRMAGSTALPLGLKLKLGAKYLPYLATRWRNVDANDPARTGGAERDSESIAAWGHRELGDEFVEWMAYPFLGAQHGGVPERTSAAFYHAVTHVGLDVRLWAVVGGVGRLAAAIGSAFEKSGGELRREVVVEDVRWESGEVRVRADREEWAHEAAVIALPATSITAFGVVGLELREWLSRVDAPLTLTLALVTDRPIRREWFGLVFPRALPPGDRVVAACVAASKVDGLVPAERGLLVVMPSPPMGERLARSPEEAPDLLLPAVEHGFPGITESVVQMKAYRHREGRTQFGPGYLRHLLRYDVRWLPERVVLAGDYLTSPTVEGAVLSGERAAQALMKGWESRNPAGHG